MPKKKTEDKNKEEEVVVEELVAVVTEEPIDIPVPELGQEEVFMPVFETIQVRYIMKDNRSNMTHFHCKMSDGTTRHVPRGLFK